DMARGPLCCRAEGGDSIRRSRTPTYATEQLLQSSDGSMGTLGRCRHVIKRGDDACATALLYDNIDIVSHLGFTTFAVAGTRRATSSAIAVIPLGACDEEPSLRSPIYSMLFTICRTSP